MRFIILRNHEETLKHSSLLSIKTTFGELIFIVDCRYRYTEAFKIAHARKTCLCLTEVSSMTTCQFNNLSSLCTANFSEGKRQLCTCYHFSIVQKHTSTQFPLPKREKQFITLGKTDRVKLKGVQVYSFAYHSAMTWPHLSSRAGRILYGFPWDTSAEDVLMRTGWDSGNNVQTAINGVCLCQVFKRLHRHGI